jgi:PhnB protein
MAEVKPIPAGFHAITPHIVCRGAADAIEWYKKAFGAVERGRMTLPDGKSVMHSLIFIGDSPMMIVDEFPQWNSVGPQTLGNSPVTLHLYVTDADAMMNRAVAAGAKVIMPMMDAFWGDRYGKIEDPFGHHWSIATHVRDMTPEEMAEAGKKAFSKPMQ